MNFPLRRPDLVLRPEPTSAAEVVAEAAASAGMAASPLAAARAAAGVHVNSEGEVKPWGSPMGEVVPVRNPRVRPDTENGWGRTESDLLPNGKKPELARVELEISEPLTISVDVLQNPGMTVTEPIVPLTVWALVTFGNGSTNVTRAIRCDYRFDVTVVASYVQVQVYIGEPDSSAPYIAPHLYDPALPQQVPAQVAAQVARGIRGLPYVCTQFVTEDDASEVVIINQACRILSVEAHLTAVAGAPQFLQFFDQANNTGPGGPPILEYPLGQTPFPGLILTRFLNPRGFSQGIFAVISSTSGTYSPSGAQAHIEVEQLLL
jgi:hypothetical protein